MTPESAGPQTNCGESPATRDGPQAASRAFPRYLRALIIASSDLASSLRAEVFRACRMRSS